MRTSSVKVTDRYQISLPQQVRKRLKIKRGDQLLIDVQDGMIILLPERQSYSQSLAGLHREIWINAGKYIFRERDAWPELPITNGKL